MIKNFINYLFSKKVNLDISNDMQLDIKFSPNKTLTITSNCLKNIPISLASLEPTKLILNLTGNVSLENISYFNRLISLEINYDIDRNLVEGIYMDNVVDLVINNKFMNKIDDNIWYRFYSLVNIKLNSNS